MTSEEKVKKVYPDARVERIHLGFDCETANISTFHGSAAGSCFGSDIVQAAWDDAASRLPKEQTFEEWWDNFHWPGYGSGKDMALAAWNAAKGIK